MISFTCPRCSGPLTEKALDRLHCAVDGLDFYRRDGIWRFLLPEDEFKLATFLREYQIIRQKENRGSDEAAFYRRLPAFRVPEGGENGAPVEGVSSMAAMWRMRAASYQTFARRILPTRPGPLRVLDLGAGNGWLSNRLAQAGHELHALDVLDNDWDGLGTYVHYETAFTPVQASFDRLPYPPSSFDLIVFNASFHYATDYLQTLQHVQNRLAPDGRIVILDTPVYRNRTSGLQMVREREARFTLLYGFPSNALPMENFLTWDQIDRLCAVCGLSARFTFPGFGWRRTLASLLARLKGRREQAQFPVIELFP